MKVGYHIFLGRSEAFNLYALIKLCHSPVLGIVNHVVKSQTWKLISAILGLAEPSGPPFSLTASFVFSKNLSEGSAGP